MLKRAMPEPQTSSPQTPGQAAVEAVYANRRQTLSDGYAASVRQSTVARLLLLAASAALVALLIAAAEGRLPMRYAGMPLVVLLAAIAWWLRIKEAQDRLARLVGLYDRALARVRGTAVQTGLTGEELRPTHHLFDRDLAILGPDSLFGALATVRTGLGQRALAELLLHPSTSVAEIRARQAAVRELAPELALRERIALLGVSTAQQLPATQFDRWLADPPTKFPRYLPPVLTVLSATLVAGLLAGAAHWLPWSTLLPNLGLITVLQAGLAWSVRPRVLPLLEGGKRLQAQILMLRDGLQLLQRLDVQAPYLQALQARIPAQAPRELRSLHSLFSIAEQRSKEYFYVISLLVAAGTQTAIAIERWRLRHGPAMRDWIAAWSHFEAMAALATYAHEHPDHTFPELIDPELIDPELIDTPHRPAFEVTGLAHPLLPNAVPNAVTLDAETRLLLISGSNMAGKSTLLRTLGVNAVLAQAGAPVRATSARLTPMQIGASVALTDSLAEGRSRFLAEVERIRDILALTRPGEHGEDSRAPVLFLIDEIFSGTNSLDRQRASDGILRSLIRQGAVGALSTHDLALTAIAEEPELHARNVHMASGSPEDPLAFDYLLKPGVNTSSSAAAILRMLQVD